MKALLVLILVVFIVFLLVVFFYQPIVNWLQYVIDAPVASDVSLESAQAICKAIAKPEYLKCLARYGY